MLSVTPATRRDTYNAPASVDSDNSSHGVRRLCQRNPSEKSRGKPIRRRKEMSRPRKAPQLSIQLHHKPRLWNLSLSTMTFLQWELIRRLILILCVLR